MSEQHGIKTARTVELAEVAPSTGASGVMRDQRAPWVVAFAAAAIALHVVVDAFIAPEPGASRVEQLPAAAVSLAVLALLLALSQRRARPMLCASLLVPVGVFAIVRAVVALTEIVDRGAGAADWTALLLFPAGAVFVAVGIQLAWRSRRGDGRRWLRRALLIVGALLAAYWVVYPAAMAIVATEKPRAAVEPADLGKPYEDVTIRSSDGLALRGWYVPTENGAAVIAFPGRKGPIPHARMLVRHGYGVLMLDMRGQGDSEGDPNTFGWQSSRDVDAAVAYLAGRPDVRDGRIGGLGLSVGGEVLLETAASNAGLRAVVAEGSGLRSVRETFVRDDVSAVQVWLQAPMEAVLTAATALLSADAPPRSLEDLAAQIAPRPVFFIYGERGQAIEAAVTPAYAAAVGPSATVWEVPGAGHTGGIDAQPREYERLVIRFFDEALLAR